MQLNYSDLAVSMVHHAWSRTMDQYHSLLAVLAVLALLSSQSHRIATSSSYAQSHSSDLVSLLDDERLLLSVWRSNAHLGHEIPTHVLLDSRSKITIEYNSPQLLT